MVSSRFGPCVSVILHQFIAKIHISSPTLVIQADVSERGFGATSSVWRGTLDFHCSPEPFW